MELRPVGWFREVVIEADFPGASAMGRRVVRAQRDQRNRRALGRASQLARNFEPVYSGKTEVKNHELWAEAVELFQSRSAVVSGRNSMPEAPQQLSERLDAIDVVIYEQDTKGFHVYLN